MSAPARCGDQFKYADKRGAAIAVIEGGDERAKGEVTLKDLALGAELAKSVESRADWVGDRQAQISVKRADLVAEMQSMLAKAQADGRLSLLRHAPTSTR